MRYAARRENKMPDKITIINVFWMAMITGMLTATVALYDQKTDTSKVYGPYASARTAIISQY
ncbi:hypothetical protein [Rhizobium mongolense]|uniref:Uncharacterized protein n=3 Tax=Rhizobium TaxID=379 RepID=A0A0B4X3C3_9HYPH|nr:hypothetical protein [Rhizobium mongolense]AJD41240.1 hypothetical protein RGR602_CH01909 [Rhizobium gallicum bv. gallicum R602sp]APO67655.1 hypothetical protein IE4872_CH02038 [Rhizobium gallicum]MBB4232045.1 hypothetical protein [Rhizobium mongolense]